MLQLNKIIFAVFRCPLPYLTFSMQSSTTKCLQKVETKLSRKKKTGKSIYEFLTCLSFRLTTSRSSRSQMFFGILVLRNLANFTGKHLR